MKKPENKARKLGFHAMAGEELMSIRRRLHQLILEGQHAGLRLKETDKISKAVDKIDDLRSALEDEMFRVFPDFPDKAMKVYYFSNISARGRSEILKSLYKLIKNE